MTGDERSDPLSDVLNIVAAPVAGAIRSLDQFRKGVDEFLRGVENFNRTMEALNETTHRINVLLAEVEEPIKAAMPQVTTVQAGSPSALAGVKAGDLLLAVGFRRLGDYPDAVNAFYFLKPGTPVGVRLRRGGQELEVSVTPVERGAE